METYEYIVMRQRNKAIELQSTDPSTIHQLFDVLARTVEGYGVSASKLPTSRVFYWRLYGFGGDLERAWHLITDYLVARRWQSLSDPESAGPGKDRVACFGFDDDGEVGL